MDEPLERYVLGPEAELIVLQWPDGIEPPEMVIEGGYHRVRTGLQPRITKCYGTSYTYSGSKHPVEPDTPPEIQNIMDYTAAMYDVDTIPMCLVNYYPTCHHSISTHSDDEHQFGNIPDVICWVLGGENRRLIIRNKATKKVVLSLVLSDVIYIMKGNRFQKDFTHEMPKEYEALFKRMCTRCPGSLTTLQKADWLLAHPKVGSQFKGYNEWALGRTSFTLRFFR